MHVALHMVTPCVIDAEHVEPDERARACRRSLRTTTAVLLSPGHPCTQGTWQTVSLPAQLRPTTGNRRCETSAATHATRNTLRCLSTALQRLDKTFCLAHSAWS